MRRIAMPQSKTGYACAEDEKQRVPFFAYGMGRSAALSESKRNRVKIPWYLFFNERNRVNFK